MNEHEVTENKITGKQILSEIEELLQNIGEYLFQVGKTVYVKVKVALADKDKKSDGDDEITDSPEKAQ